MKRLTGGLVFLLGVLSLALACYQLGRGHGYEDGSNAADYSRGYRDGQNAVVCAIPQQ